MATLGVLALVSMLGAAPAGECARACDAIAAETDRQTCLLQCDQSERPSDGTGVQKWRREERLGGAPPGSKHENESGTTTTIETTRRDGATSVETTTTRRSGATVAATPASSPVPTKAPQARNMSAAGPWIVLAKCQLGCDVDRNARTRATCKLGCLDASPGLVRRAR
jgi:hypothetical protein